MGPFCKLMQDDFVPWQPKKRRLEAVFHCIRLTHITSDAGLFALPLAEGGQRVAEYVMSSLKMRVVLSDSQAACLQVVRARFDACTPIVVVWLA